MSRRRTLRAAGALLLLVAGSLAATGGVARAANPIIANRFVADPSAHVFNNRMYIYATDDETNSGTYWDSKVWRAYSSTNLTGWTDHGSFFGINGGFAWADQLAWAPTAAYRDGFYYFYAPVDRTKIGVARSTSPTSGFRPPHTSSTNGHAVTRHHPGNFFSSRPASALGRHGRPGAPMY